MNRLLSPGGVRLETLTRDNAEAARLTALRETGHFDRAVFPLLDPFRTFDATPVFEAVSRYQARFEDFADRSRNAVGFSFDNGYFTSPDAEVLYAMVRERAPRRIVEVGSGHSTQIIRQAVLDGGFRSEIIAIDPAPRRDVKDFADVLHPVPVEVLARDGRLPSLESGDLLFIDSSHMVAPGTDVVYLYLTLIPQLPPGVLIHIHDIFLPFDYPADWIVDKRYGWNEQYLVQALLMSGRFEVMWPGRFVQISSPDFGRHFPSHRGVVAQSLWLRTTAQLPSTGGTR